MLEKYRQDAKYYLETLKKYNLPEQCKIARANLTMLMTNSDIFSERLTSQLMPSAVGVPHQIHPDDPDQIVILKKLDNILYNVAAILSELEKIPADGMDNDDFLIANLPIIIKNTYKAIHQGYEALQLVNQSGPAVQAIIGPQYDRLKLGFDSALENVNTFTPEGAKNDLEQKLGKMIGKTIDLLPTQSKTAEDIGFTDLGDLIVNIPNYFTRLQEIIENESLQSDDKKATSSAAEYQHALFEQRAKKIAHNLEQMTTKTGLGLAYKYWQIIRQLGAHSVDLINTGAPATKEAYLKSVKKLNQFKHEILPNVLAELRSLERSIGLTSGILTEPAFDAAEIYYRQLITYVNKIQAQFSILELVETHGNRLYGRIGRHLLFGDSKHIDSGEKLEKDEQLTVLMDKCFIKKIKTLQAKNLDEAKIRLHETQQSAQSAHQFFTKVESLNTYDNNGNFSNIAIEDKQELAHLYKQFQSSLAATNPALDARIVNFLNSTTKEKEQFNKKEESTTLLQSLWGSFNIGVAYTLINAQHFLAAASNTLNTSENEFSTILEKENQLIAFLRKKEATERLEIGLLEDSRSQIDQSVYARAGKKTTLEVIDALPKLHSFTFAKKQSAQEIYKKSLVMENQIAEISQAQIAFSNFMGSLEELTNKNQALSNLSDEEKEQLRYGYNQFQKFIYHLSENDLSLSDLDAQIVDSLMNNESKLTIEQLLAFKDPLKSSFEKLQIAFAKDRDLYFGQEAEARKAPISFITLKPVDGAKTTLFGQINELKLATKLDNFIKGSLLPFLEENLSAEVLEALDLEHTTLPYKDTSLDVSQVSLYKNLINAFYSLQKGLAEFEQKGDHEYTENFLNRAFFLSTTGKSVSYAVKDAFFAIVALKGNSQLVALAEQGLDILGPIKQIPGLSSFFADEKEVNPATAKPKNPAELIGQSVYQLQLSLLDLVNRTEPHQLAKEYKNLKKLFIDTQFVFLRNAEAIFDLKEESLTAKLNEILNRFESNIDKEGAELDLFFGVRHPNLETFYDKLEEKLENIDSGKPLAPEIKTTIIAIYKELLPFLKEKFPEFDEHFIDKITESSQLKLAVEQLLDTEKFFYQPGIIRELQNLFYYYEPDFTKEFTQEEFKNSYKLLQPYLQSLDPDYYSDQFLESLKSSPDYEAALTKIVRDNSKELISLINEKKRNSFYSQLLLETHELRQFIIATNSTLTESMIKEKEKMAKEMQLKRELAGIPEPEKKPSMLKQMIEGLYQVQAKINELFSARVIAENTDEATQFDLFTEPDHPYVPGLIQSFADEADLRKEIEDIVNSFSNIEIMPNQIANVLKSIQKLRAALNNTAVESRELILASLKELRSKFCTSIIIHADNAEFILGLKTGVLSSEGNKRFDKLYKGLLESIAQTSEQKDLLLLIDTTSTEKRIENEKERWTATVKKTDSELATETEDFNSKLAEARIWHLLEQLASEKKQGQDRVEQFKRLKFEQILDVNIRSMLTTSLGSYTDPFFKHIRPSFIKIQEKIIRDITVNDNIEDKIATRLASQFNLLMAKIDKSWKTEVNIEPALIAFDTEDELILLQGKYSIFYNTNDLYREIGAIKDDFEKQDPAGKNQLIQSIINQIALFRDEISQFTQAYKLNDKVNAHGEKVIEFMNQLKNYQIIIQNPYLEQYNQLQAKKEALTQDLRQKNPIFQQKFDLIENYERHIIEYVKSHDSSEMLAEIKSFHQKLKVFDELIAVYLLNEQLLANLKQNGEKDIPTVYVDSWVYTKLSELKDKIKSYEYYTDTKFEEKLKNDKAAFAQYYSEIQPLLIERDPAFTPELYDHVPREIDELEPLRMALKTLAPKLNQQILDKAKERLQQIELARALKQILEHPDMGPEQRKRVVIQFIKNEIETLPPPSFPDRVYDFFKIIFESIKQIFTGKSPIESAEKNFSEIRDCFKFYSLMGVTVTPIDPQISNELSTECSPQI